MGGGRFTYHVPGEGYWANANTAADKIGYPLSQYMAFDYEHLIGGESSIAGSECSPDNTTARQEGEVMDAMEKDWNEYVAGVRAQAREAAAQFNGEGRCHETGIEDFVSKGMGPNMMEMNGPEPVPLKMGPLPECPQDLVKERGQTHGDFLLHALITQDLKAVLRKYGYLTKLKAHQREALDMNMHKVGRIVAGDPDFPDHWKDIAGYSWLVVERCK